MAMETGKLVEWNDARGYGFIAPVDRPGERVFLHIGGYRRMGRRPESGEILRYVPEVQPDGRVRATRVVRPASAALHRHKADKAWAAHRGAASTWMPPILLAAYLPLLAMAWWWQLLPGWAWGALAAANVLCLLLYAHDKRAALAGARRVPEAELHLLELLGGWPAALLAQQALRHKSRKPGYRRDFLAAVLLHVAALGAWLWFAGA